MDMSNGAPKSATEEEIASANRARARSSIFLAGKVTLEGVKGELDVRVRNLSATGAMLQFTAPIPVHRGQKVHLSTKGIGDVDGVVAWATNGRIGIAFSEMVNPDDTKLVALPNGIFEAGVPGHITKALQAIAQSKKF